MRIVITRRESLDTPDGINVFIFSLAEAFLLKGHEVYVVAGMYTDINNIFRYFQLKKYPRVICLSSFKQFSYIRQIATWLINGKNIVEEISPDLVLVNGSLPFSFSAPTFVVSHDVEARPTWLDLLRIPYKNYSYRKAHYIIATCSEIRAALSKELNLDLDRIRVIPVCFNLNSYIRKDLKDRRRAILHIGTASYKNPEMTIKAFSLLKMDEAQLYITGRIDDKMSQLLSSLPSNVQKRITFLGYLSSSELKEMLGAVRVVSVPSTYRVPVCSPSAIESLISGTPVIGSSSISQDVLIHKYNGFLADTEEDYALRMQQLLEDDELWLAMNSNAVESSQKFSAFKVADLYVNLLHCQ